MLGVAARVAFVGAELVEILVARDLVLAGQYLFRAALCGSKGERPGAEALLRGCTGSTQPAQQAGAGMGRGTGEQAAGTDKTQLAQQLAAIEKDRLVGNIVLAQAGFESIGAFHGRLLEQVNQRHRKEWVTRMVTGSIRIITPGAPPLTVSPPFGPPSGKSFLLARAFAPLTLLSRPLPHTL